MKTFRLIFSRLISDFQRNKAMMILYFVGSILCVLVFIYFFNNIQVLNREYQEEKEQLPNRKYVVSLKEKQPLNISDFDFLKDYDIENIGAEEDFNIDNKQIQVVTFSSTDYLYDSIPKQLRDKVNFSLTDKQMSENIIVSNSEKDIYKINNIDFKNIHSEVLSGIYIPTNAFINNNFTTQKISIVLSKCLNASENSSFIELLETKLGSSYKIDNISNPLDHDSSKLNEIIFELIRLCLIYIICFIGCAFLFKYIFDMNRYENIIYSIVGSSKIKVLFLMILEAVIISVISILFAIILHISLYDCFFSLINRENIQYTVNDYLIISGFSIILSVITLIPFFISYVKNPILSSKSKYK
ncbi:MAG: hypothetical protein PUG48_06535 [Clostridia bacterium]|nr:hypothetical protein [Clostridia bacterium]